MAKDQVDKYIDIVHTHPELSLEELEELIEQYIKEDEQLTEWEDL